MKVKKSQDDAKKFEVHDKDKLVGSFVFHKDQVEGYAQVTNGKWLSDFAYATICDVNVMDSYQDLDYKIITLAEDICKKKNIRSLRSFIPKDDKNMKSVLKSCRFHHCGFIKVDTVDCIAYEKLVIPFVLGDKVILKKTHPCGGDLFEIVRLGMDIKLECQKCQSVIWLKRNELSKKIKKRLY